MTIEFSIPQVCLCDYQNLRIEKRWSLPVRSLQIYQGLARTFLASK
ncbi:hypothetical protein [uncultured Nostoc sp.]